jgi:chromosome segregation ATPase
MNEMAATTSRPGRSSVTLAVLFGLVLALAVASGFLFFQLDGLKQEMAKTKDTVLFEIAKDRQISAAAATSGRQNLEALRAELEAARAQAASAAGRARKEAAKHATMLAEKLADEQRRQQELLAGELNLVKEATGTANQKISDVSTDVTSVKNDVATTKTELEKTISELKSMQGDLGVQSGLIATNSKELAALRAIGERNYFEFEISKTKRFQRVGDVSLLLKKSDPKRNRYTVEVLADDKKVEKKDKTANEPVQFYVGHGRQPYEIVVNEVKKDRILGYLATPKVMQSRRS